MRTCTERGKGGDGLISMLTKALSAEEISEAIPEESEEAAIQWRVGSHSELVAPVTGIISEEMGMFEGHREAGAHRSWGGHRMRLERGRRKDWQFKCTEELLEGLKTRWCNLLDQSDIFGSPSGLCVETALRERQGGGSGKERQSG